MDRESREFTDWWNATCDPDETGRTRMMAAHAYEAGRYDREYRIAITNLQHAALEVLKSLPVRLRGEQAWSTPLIVASLDGHPEGEQFIVRVERI